MHAIFCNILKLVDILSWIFRLIWIKTKNNLEEKTAVQKQIVCIIINQQGHELSKNEQIKQKNLKLSEASSFDQSAVANKE